MHPIPRASALDDLRSRIRRELETLAYPTPAWVEPVAAPDGTVALDCAVIGAGQYGLTLGAGLRRERVERIGIFDVAEPGREGPWVTFARMSMLRTPKTLTGPDLGLPSLSFRAWWEAQHGADGWAAMFRIPRTSWMDYLNFYREALDLPVTNGWRLASLEPVEGSQLLRLGFETVAEPRTVFARSCVLATGAAGFSIPEWMAQAVPADRVYHANHAFDPAVLRGMRVGVLGAGASGFDTAVAALAAGARSADLCFRRPALPLTNPRRWMENAGYLAHYVDLPDARKWAMMHRLLSIGQGPPKPTYDAAMATPGFALHPATPWDSICWSGSEILVEGGGRRFAFDAVVAATGMRVDLAERPEMAAIAAEAALWSDRYAPPPEEANPALGRFPYLDRLGAFTEREAGRAPWLSRVLTITRGATLSLGPVSASNSGMKYTAPRLIEGVKRCLFLDQEAATWREFIGGDHTELPREAVA
ncbi:NAD(P)/FAD-dependent oxidoreductase [Roseomonas sp. KE2513]|uniref:FAD/NAD(P)-binding protein n=1 Tax=Roseomonas sp. KE2513 TaxID=2479202 RepID=UPI0018DFB70D|nr:FAD/NAD(P)-binding protein [Roseomonas sp. KE2513]MBI0535788.1 NAD(P)/FAD-dependent oxidoreductase [Roseomonas sp. KE2513]